MEAARKPVAHKRTASSGGSFRAGLKGAAVLALGASLLLSGAGPAGAIWVNLTADQAEQAQKIGGFTASMGNPAKFMEKWTVSLGEGKGAALLMTEFLSVAFAAQTASRNMAALQPWEVQDAMARARGKLVFSVTTFGKTPDYADDLRGWVLYGKKRIQNTHWQNGKPEPYKDGTYVADSTFWFPIQDVDPEGQVTLLIQQSKTGEEWRFPFDLKGMR
jgi:hypothetical protein